MKQFILLFGLLITFPALAADKTDEARINKYVTEIQNALDTSSSALVCQYYNLGINEYLVKIERKVRFTIALQGDQYRCMGIELAK